MQSLSGTSLNDRFSVTTQQRLQRRLPVTFPKSSFEVLLSHLAFGFAFRVGFTTTLIIKVLSICTAHSSYLERGVGVDCSAYHKEVYS